MTQKEYYTAPEQEVFEEIKARAIEIWKSYDNTHGYVDEKLARIEHIRNIQDNTAYIVAMFDNENQNKLRGMLKNQKAIDWLDSLLDYARS